MKRIWAHRAAAAVILASLTVAAPALARDKKEAEQPKGPQLSAAVRTAAVPAQTALQNKDVATAAPLVAQVEAAAQTDDEKYIAYVLRFNLEVVKLHAANGGPAAEQALTGPLDNLINSPKTPPADKARYAYQRGIIAYNAKAYADSARYFTQAKAGGYTDPNLDLQLVRAKVEGGDTAGGLGELDRMSNQGKLSEELYRYAIAKANQRNDKTSTLTWLNKYLAAYPTGKNYRDVLSTYALVGKPVATLTRQQKIDLYRLMDAAKGLADQGDYEDYAQKVADVGLPDESKRVIAEGRAANRLPAAGGNAAMIMKEADAAIRTEGPLTALEKKAAASSDGKLASQTGDAYLGQRNYAKAIELYTLALQKGGVVTDDVNTHIGIAKAMSGDKAGALAAFQAVKTPPRSDLAQFWVTFVNNPPSA